MSQRYDVIIIGSGPAGYTAALYSARAELETLVFQGLESGGQLMLTTEVENYPGYPEGTMGPDMMEDLEAQAARFGAEMRPDNVERVDLSQRPFKVWGEDEEEPVLANSVIIATGSRTRWLGIPGEAEFRGHGVSSCATCDGFFFKDKKVLVVGGGDSAMEEALFLAKFASEVNVVHRRDEFRASKIMLNRAQKEGKISFTTDTVAEEILGDGTVEKVRLRNVKTGEESEVRTDGFFVAIGHDPATEVFAGQVELDAQGYIPQKHDTMTNVEGVFSAGDVSDARYQQAVTAAGDGCRASIDAERWLAEQGEAEETVDPAIWSAPADIEA